MIGVVVQLVPALLLRGTPADVARDRPRELELVVAALGEDLLAVLVHHVGQRHPQALGPPCCEQRALVPGPLAREDGELHAQRAGDRVREGHAHDLGSRGPVLHCGQEGSFHQGDAIHAAQLLWVGLNVEPLLRKG